MELHQEPQWREKAIKNLVEILSAYRMNVRHTTRSDDEFLHSPLIPRCLHLLQHLLFCFYMYHFFSVGL